MRIRWMIRIKPIVALLLSIAMIVSFCGCSNKSNNAQNENETEFQAYYEPLTSDDIATEGDVYYASSQMLLTSVNDATYEDIEKLIKKNGGEIVGYISATGDYQIRFNDSKTFEELEQLIENLKNDALIEDASLAYVAQFSNEAINYTNDPWIDADDPSDTSGSVWDEDNPDGKNWWAEAIDMPTVWSMDLSTQTVKVGIIDSMFDTTNEDLDENLFAKTWNNPTNDDGSCRVTQLYNDAVAAYDQAVLSKDQDAIDNASSNISNASHGTHVAGIIAAQADNGFGIAGVNQNVKLYGYSVLSDESTVSDEGQWGSIFQYKCAIAHLLNEGVKVINISMGYNDALMGTQDGDSYWSTFTSVNSKSLESFLLKYIEAGNEFLIVKSAGNDSSTDKKYDAGNDVFGAISNDLVSQRIIIVGATRYNTKYDYYPIADFSNTGSRVDVYAPGVDVLSDIPSNVTALKSGTSMSTPVVSGLASLIWGINPALSAEQVRGFILASTSATMFDLDDESFIIRDLINWVADPTAIVNADICVQLAQATIGNGNNSDAEYGTVSGMVYAITSDESNFVDINIETLSLYNEKGALISTIPLQDIAYRVSDDDTGTVSILNLHTYSALLEPGTYTLKAEVDGYDVQSHQITISPNDVVNVDFEFIAINGENYNSFADVIIDVQNRINYTRYPDPQKEYCRGDFFEVDGKNALVLMYHVLNGAELTPGYYVGLWVENSDGTISCLTDQLIEEVGDPDDAYVTVNIRKIDGKMYLNPYVRTTNNNTDISKNQYYLIGDELVLEYDLQSEAPFVSMGDGLIQHDDSKSVYYLNQEQVDRSTFYSTQDKLNIRTYVLGLNPNWSEGRPPEGHTFEELLAQLGDEAEVDTEETQGESVFYEDGFVGNETVEQLRKSIVGSWGAEGSVVSDYDFNSEGACYWFFFKQTEGTYQIRDDKMLVITFPWMDDRYFWTEETYEEWRSHSSQDCWYITDAGVLILNGVSYYRDGKVIKDYNTEGGLLATISGAWVMDDFMEYRFFMDGTFEENTVFVSNGMLLNRVDIDAGPIEIIDDTHAKLWHEADSFGEIPYYTELVYDPETDTLRIGGSNNVYHRAEYLD